MEKKIGISQGVHYFFLGMGFVASSAAIGNVVTVEMTFKEWLRHGVPGNGGLGNQRKTIEKHGKTMEKIKGHPILSVDLLVDIPIHGGSYSWIGMNTYVVNGIHMDMLFSKWLTYPLVMRNGLLESPPFIDDFTSNLHL